MVSKAMQIANRLFHAETVGDAIWRTAMMVVVIATMVAAVATYSRADDDKSNTQSAADNAVLAREASEDVKDLLAGFQDLADRGGCTSQVYARFYLAISNVIITGNQESRAMTDSRDELQGLVDGTVCPVPTIQPDNADPEG